MLWNNKQTKSRDNFEKEILKMKIWKKNPISIFQKKFSQNNIINDCVKLEVFKDETKQNNLWCTLSGISIPIWHQKPFNPDWVSKCQ